MGLTWRLRRTIHVGIGYLYRAAVTADGASVVTLSNDDGALRSYSLATGRPLGRYELLGHQRFDAADFALLGGGLASVLTTTDRGVDLIDLGAGETLAEVAGLPPGDSLERTLRPGLFFHAARSVEPQSGQLILAWLAPAAEDPRVVRVRLAAVLRTRERPDGWALSAGGRLLAVSYYPSGSCDVIELTSGKVLGTFALPRWGGAVALSPDGSLLALGGERLRLFALPSGELIGEDSAYGNNIGNLTFTADGSLLLVSAFDGKARSYALRAGGSSAAPAGAKLDGLPSPQLLAHAGSANVYGLGLSEDGRTLVTSSGDQTLKVWSR